MIVIAGHVAGVEVLNLAGSVGKAVPNGFAFAIFVPRTFNLVGGGCRTPPEIFRECDAGAHIRCRGKQVRSSPSVQPGGQRRPQHRSHEFTTGGLRIPGLPAENRPAETSSVPGHARSAFTVRAFPQTEATADFQSRGTAQTRCPRPKPCETATLPRPSPSASTASIKS